jgi:hypothetical protein
MLSDLVQEHDEPILKHLLDIKVIFLESNPMVSFGQVIQRYAFTHLLLADTKTEFSSGSSLMTVSFEIVF